VGFEVGGASSVVCASLCQCIRLGVLLIVSVSLFFPPHFGVSAWRLKCTKHVGCNGDVVQ
jgi:hypothetical protein